MLMHVAGTFPDNYVYGKCTYYIWEYGEIGENNTYLCTDHVPQVYIPCRIPCMFLSQLQSQLFSHYSLLNKHSTSKISYWLSKVRLRPSTAVAPVLLLHCTTMVETEVGWVLQHGGQAES